MLLSKIRSIFDRTPEEPKVQFGRYTSAHPDPQIYVEWVKAVSYFESERYLDSYRSLLAFLKAGNASVSFSENDSRIQFSMVQGSKIIFGYGNRRKFTAYAQIVLAKTLPFHVARSLLEANYDLKYCAFGLDVHNCIVLQFQTLAEDGSPYKIYQALEELALEADRQDDILGADYHELEPINTYHTQKNSTEISKIKFAFLQSRLADLETQMDRLSILNDSFPGAISYALLDFVYAVDYLIKPAGRLMEQLYSFHDLFFHNNTINVIEKNILILQSLRTLHDLKFSGFRKELYESQSSFAPVERDNTLTLQDLIFAQEKDLIWYSDNGYPEVTKAICGYIVGCALYTMTLSPALVTILQLYYKVQYRPYFISLGFACDFMENNDTILVKKLRKHIKQLVADSKENMSIQVKKLKSKEMSLFPREFIGMLNTIEFKEVL